MKSEQEEEHKQAMMMSVVFVAVALLVITFFLFRIFLYRSAQRWWHWIEDGIHPQQLYRVPQFNHSLQDNLFYSQVSTYLNSLSSSIDESHFTNLFSSAGKKPNDLVLSLGDNQLVHDTFLSARVTWTNQVHPDDGKKSFVLAIKTKDKRRILQPYLRHIQTVSDENRRQVKLFINASPQSQSQSQSKPGRWTCVPFTHPSTLETIVMDPDLKNRIRSDLEAFLKSKQYYHRLGRAWKRSYLLYGPSGTGKSSFIAAMAKFLSYDLYDVDLSRVSDDSDLKLLLLQINRKSLIVVEDLDRFLTTDNSLSFSAVLNFMDGIINSCCMDEKVMVFTMHGKDLIDPVMLRPGRIDLHIHFPLCNFSSFKTLAETHLGLKDHKLFPQVEEIFMTGATMSPAEIGEIMIINRSSPSRALKSVITALQAKNTDARRLTEVASSSTSSARVSAVEAGEGGALSWKDVGSPAVKEIRKLYGILRMKSSSRRTVPFDLDSGAIQRSQI